MGELSNYKEIQDQYKFIVENSLSAIYIFQKDHLVYVNRACETLTGYSQEELLKLHYLDLIHPDDRDWMEHLTNSVLSVTDTNEQPQPEFRIMTKDGSTRWVRLIPNLVLHEKKKTIIGHILDIHSQKQIENKLKESEEKYRLLVENAVEAILVVQDWQVKYINPQAIRLSGYSEKEFKTLTLDEIIHPEDLPMLKRRHQMRLEGKEFDHVYPFRIYDKKGNIRWGIINVVVIPWEGKKATLNFIHDITEQKKAQDKLKKSEKTFRELVERASDGIAIIQDKRFQYVNKKLAEMHGCSTEDMLGDYFFNYVSEKEKQRVIERNEKRSRGEDVPTIYASEIVTKEGKEKPVEFNAGMVTYNGKPANMVLVRDITERKKAENRLKKSLKEKDVLLREIHHRVKNNMQIMSSLLRLQAAGTKDKMAKKILQESRGRIYTMALVHEKLYQSKDLSNIDMGRYIQVFVPHLFHTFDASARKISLHMQCESVELDITRAIPCGLIINELVSNAIKHAFPGDRKGKMCIDLRREKGKIIFGVKDNGVGLSEHVDVRQSETMGFQIVNDLVKQLRADMKIISENGIKFEIVFPA
jgi:PAS domain S-box-containing protein